MLTKESKMTNKQIAAIIGVIAMCALSWLHGRRANILELEHAANCEVACWRTDQ